MQWEPSYSYIVYSTFQIKDSPILKVLDLLKMILSVYNYHPLIEAISNMVDSFVSPRCPLFRGSTVRIVIEIEVLCIQ